MKKKFVKIGIGIVLLLVLITALSPIGRNLYLQSLIKQADQDFKNSLFDNAKEKYLKALQLSPRNEQILSNLGDICYSTHRYKEALDYYNKALSINPKEPRYYFNIAMVYRRTGELERAAAQFRKTMEIERYYPGAAKQLSDILWQLNRHEEAVEVLQEYIDHAGVDNEGILAARLSMYLQKTGKTEESITLLEEISKDPKSDRKPLIRLLHIYERNNDRENAIRTIERLLNEVPEDLESYSASGGYYRRQNNYQGEESVLKQGVKNLSHNVDAYLMLFEFYRHHQQYDNAIETLENALSADPNSYIIYFLLGVTHYENKDFVKAEEELKRAVSIKADEPVVLNMLSWMYLTAPPQSPQYNPQEALRLARRAVSLAPDVSAFVDTLARAYYSNEQFEESIAKYQENLQQEKNLDYSYYGLAVNSFKQNKIQEGEAYLKKALEMNFDDKGLLQHDLDLLPIKNHPKIKEIMELP